MDDVTKREKFLLKVERIKLLKATISDVVADFIYYDRKEDEDLPRDAIEEMIERGDVTVEWIIEEFKTCLLKALGGEED